MNLTISSIVPHPRKGDRYEVALDGEVVALLSSAQVSELRLRAGDVINETVRNRILEAAERLRVVDAALGMLSRAPRSLAELRRKLLARGERAVTVLWALDRLQKDGVASDESYARQYVRSRLRRNISSRMILSALSRAGVERSLAESTFASVAAEESWEEAPTAARVAEKKIRSLLRLDPAVAKRRLIGFLSRKGFSASDVTAAVRSLARQQRDGADD